MKQYGTELLRNVGLFSHGGAGKTTLAEAMLFNAGTVNRMGQVEEGSTVSDYDPEETKRHISVQLSVLPFEWAGKKINLRRYARIRRLRRRSARGDSCRRQRHHGHRRGFGYRGRIRARCWRYANEYNLPRMVAVTKMDRENADFNRTAEQLRDRFGAQGRTDPDSRSAPRTASKASSTYSL